MVTVFTVEEQRAKGYRKRGSEGLREELVSRRDLFVAAALVGACLNPVGAQPAPASSHDDSAAIHAYQAT
jgi:hypothetical protein